MASQRGRKIKPAVLLLIALTATMSSCGTDEGVGPRLAGAQVEPISADASPADAQPDAPVFTSADTATAIQSAQGVFHTVIASGPDAGPVSYSIVGGTHADHFVIDPDKGSLALSAISQSTPTGDLDVMIAATDRRQRRTIQRLRVALRRAGTPAEIISAQASGQASGDQRVDTRVSRGIAYAFAEGDEGNQVLRFDLYTPSRRGPNLPVIVLAHGGGFVTGSRADMEEIALDLVGRGVAVAAIDYRLIKAELTGADDLIVGAMRATHDMFGAIRYLRARSRRFQLDPDRIFAGGLSAGAIMASVAATMDPQDTISNAALGRFLAENGGVYGTVGEHAETSPAISGALSMAGAVLELPTINSGDKPIYMAHFERDTTVPCGTGQVLMMPGEALLLSGGCSMQPQLDAVGVPGKLFLVEDRDGHVTFTREEFNTLLNEASEFFGL